MDIMIGTSYVLFCSTLTAITSYSKCHDSQSETTRGGRARTQDEATWCKSSSLQTLHDVRFLEAKSQVLFWSSLLCPRLQVPRTWGWLCICIFSSGLTSEFQTWVFTQSFDISAWLSSGHMELNKCKIQPPNLISHACHCLYCRILCLSEGLCIYEVVQTRNQGVHLSSFGLL